MSRFLVSLAVYPIYLLFVAATFLIFSILLVVPQTSQAQSCGEIIYPAISEFEEYRQPITDCANPFEKTGVIENFQVNNQIVADQTTIYTEEPVIYYGVDVAEPQYLNRTIDVYRHDGDNYVVFDARYVKPPRDTYREVVSQFITDNPARAAFYADIFASDNPDRYFYELIEEDYYSDVRLLDPFTGEEVLVVFYDLYDQVEALVPKPRAALDYGTYTFVWVVSGGGGGGGVEVSNVLWRWLLPTAHAADVDIRTLTITIAPPLPTPAGASSVLFLPGIQASLLSIKHDSGGTDQVWTPLGNLDVRQLSIGVDGSSENLIYTKGILAKLPLGGTVYESFARSMVDLVDDNVIKSWTPFAYDWRYSVEDIAKNGTRYQEGIRSAIAEIEYLASTSHSGKVTIIGHSNGGLLAKAIMEHLEQEGKSSLVDKVILVASPQLGTPKAIGTILHGFDQEKLGGWIIDDEVARTVIQNMPGAYGLIPTQSYLSNATNKVISFDNSTTTQAFRNAYGPTIDSEDELRRFMIGIDGRSQAVTIDEALKANEAILTQQLTLHNTVLDNWLAPDGVEVIEIVGTGLDTVVGFEYRNFRERVCSLLGIFSCETKDFYKPVPLISLNGDKTVMLASAEGYLGLKDKYYVDLKKIVDTKVDESVEHYNITENPSVQKLLKSLLLATSSEIEFISKTAPVNTDNRTMFGVHSPAEIEVVGSNGQRVGKKVISGQVTKEEAIPNSTYLEIGTSKYVIVPTNGNYAIKVKGTAEGGLTFTVDKLSSTTQLPMVAVGLATVTASTSMRVAYTNATLSNLEVDTNGDGVIDQVLTPQGTDVTPKITYKTLQDKIKSLSLSPVRKLPLLLLVEAAETLDKKTLKNPKLSQAEALILSQLESLLVSYEKKKWITQGEQVNLLLIIKKLK